MNIKEIMQTKTYRRARYFAINGLFATCIYFGLFMGLTGAENVALFMGWGTGILGLIVLSAFAMEKNKGTMEYSELVARQDQSPIPFWFDLIFDICVSAAFIWTGHYILVLFYIASIFAGKSMRDVPKNIMLKN